MFIFVFIIDPWAFHKRDWRSLDQSMVKMNLFFYLCTLRKPDTSHPTSTLNGLTKKDKLSEQWSPVLGRGRDVGAQPAHHCSQPISANT